jgi:hypothetical protein
MTALRPYDLALELRDNSREAFVARYPAPFLLQAINPEEASGVRGFHTEAATAPISAVRLISEGFELRRDLRETIAHIVEKRSGSPWQDRIIIGRARNSDIVIHHSSVSKVHAHITTRGDGVLMARDVGSRNGIRVNGVSVCTETPVPLPMGAILGVGEVELELTNAVEVYNRFRTGVIQKTGP